jgi:hypothetical protein
VSYRPTLFFKRYEAWNEDAPYALYKSSCLEDLNDKTRSEVLHSVLRYANLCSEEFALYKAGRVPHDIWEIWNYGIQQNFQQPIWRQAWAEKRKEYDSYRAFQDYVDKIVGE